MYSALQTGVCKGGENNPNIILSDSLYEVAPYVLMDNHTTTMDVICMNLDLWESLSDEDKAIVDEAMADATAYDREIWDASIDESLQTLKDKGATIVEPDDATLDSFREAMVSISKVYDRETLELLFAHENGLMIQEFLDGQEIGADVYIDMISQEVVSIFTKKKLKMRSGLYIPS